MGNLPWENLSGIACDSAHTEIEALQTDVMRFLAILALCLMAIFALVQSIPMLPAEANPQLESRETLNHQIKVLEERVAALKRKAATLQASINLATETERQARQQAEQQRAKTEAARQRARSSHEAAAAAQKTLEEIQAALVERQGRLATLRAENTQAGLSLQALQRKIDDERGVLKRLETRLTAARKTPDPATETKLAQPAVPAPEPGFSLRFTSTDALLALVSRGVVDFYAGVGSRFWELKSAKGATVFELSTSPGQLYEMTPATVPEELVRGLRSSVATFDRDQVVWGVTLPASATADIRRLMTIHQSGVLSIQADGTVVRTDDFR